MRACNKQYLGLVVLLVSALAYANENPSQDSSKVKIIDHSRVLTEEEAKNLPNKDTIPVVVPLLKKPNRVIDPKIGVPADKPVVEPTLDVDQKLPPMPIIMPSFLNGIFEQPNLAQQPSSDDSSNLESDKPKGIVSVLLLKSHRVDDLNQGSDANSDPNVKSTSFVIMRFLPKPITNWFGVDSDNSDSSKLFGGDDDVDNKRNSKLLGGDDDVDKKRVHLLGGEGDPDRIRLNLDENNKGVFTGGNEDVFSDNMDQHKIFVFSMLDRVKSMFDNMRESFESQVQPVFDTDKSRMSESAPFISIRTDDGQSALIPNDIGYAEKQQQSLNKCMMLQFMRLKASMYYRTILHLLFFTGVLLFIFSLAMLIVRACRRRQIARRHRHLNMTISSIETGKSKLASYKAWQGMDQSSLIEPSDKIVLIQAPPAYDQVFVHDKNSTLTGRQSYVGASSQTLDECETKSLPPAYEDKSTQP